MDIVSWAEADLSPFDPSYTDQAKIERRVLSMLHRPDERRCARLDGARWKPILARLHICCGDLEHETPCTILTPMPYKMWELVRRSVCENAGNGFGGIEANGSGFTGFSP